MFIEAPRQSAFLRQARRQSPGPTKDSGHAYTGGPVHVSVNIYLRSISKIDDVNMEYSAQFTFREEWQDPRLAYERFADENTQVPPFVVLATSEQSDLAQHIWMPDTFFQNEKYVSHGVINTKK
uniref:Neur_chan_LBD domain-containing protein n=1 Tax=Steinernema glaseri TaxID=37863 RepID=A0A1I7Y0J9_9BILA